jgi:hypothetical protein
MFNYNPILGYNNVKASVLLSRKNALMGKLKQVHSMILVYKNKPQKAALLQEAMWKGGNKNEFILCIGIDENEKIDWTYIISWTENEKLKIDVRDSVKNLDFDLENIVYYMSDEVEKRFIRKQFKDFSYIKVEPTTKSVFITFIVVIVLTFGVCLFSIFNGVDLEKS